MLSIEEIKLLIEKLERVKKEDLQELIDSNLKILKDLELAVDANNKEVIDIYWILYGCTLPLCFLVGIWQVVLCNTCKSLVNGGG